MRNKLERYASGYTFAEIAITVYIILSGLLFLLFTPLESLKLHQLISRAGIIMVLIALKRLSQLKELNGIEFIRRFFILLFLGYFYDETHLSEGMINKSLDPILVKSDAAIFSFQPSILFSELIPYAWFSELMNFGYFSYYPLIFGILIYIYFYKKHLFQKYLFIILCSFFLYYLIFILLPSTGPQYYFRGEFRNIPEGYLFYHIMNFISCKFEAPTGAFPSSHVGLAFIILIIFLKESKTYLWFIVPIVLLLLCSTIYLKAHYFVDIMAGIIAGVIFYFLFERLFITLNQKI